MDEKLLPENFFENEPLEKISAAQIAYFSMSTEFDEQLETAMEDTPQPDRLERIGAEQQRIAQLETGEAVVKFIRSGCDIANRNRLCWKALSMEDEVMPLLLRRFRTSFQEELVETAAHILSQAEPEYIRQLEEMYPEIRNPYAQSMACLVFGIQQEEEMLPLLLKEYERMKREYPGRDLCQGPLLAIYILYDMA